MGAMSLSLEWFAIFYERKKGACVERRLRELAPQAAELGAEQRAANASGTSAQDACLEAPTIRASSFSAPGACACKSCAKHLFMTLQSHGGAPGVFGSLR